MSGTASRASMRSLARSVVTGRRSMDSTASTALIDLETELPAQCIPDQTRYSVDVSPSYADPPSAKSIALGKVTEHSSNEQAEAPCEIRIFTPASSPGLRVMASSKRRITKIRGSKTDTSSSSSPSTQPSTKRPSSETVISSHGRLNAKGFPRTGTPRMGPRSRKSSSSAAKATASKGPSGPSFKLFSSTGSLACVPLLSPPPAVSAASQSPKATSSMAESKKTAAADVLKVDTSDLVSLCSTGAGADKFELHEALEDEATSIWARDSSDDAETAVETWSISVDIEDDVGRATPWAMFLNQEDEPVKLPNPSVVATMAPSSSQDSSLSMSTPPNSAGLMPSSYSTACSTSESRSSEGTDTSPASVDSRPLHDSEGDCPHHSACPSIDVSQRPAEFEDGSVQNWASLLALRGEQSRDKRASLRRSYMQSQPTLQEEQQPDHLHQSNNSCGLTLGPDHEDSETDDRDATVIKGHYKALQSFLEVSEGEDSPALSATGATRVRRQRVIPSLIPPSLAATREATIPFKPASSPRGQAARRRRGNKSDLPPQSPAPRVPLPPVPEAFKVELSIGSPTAKSPAPVSASRVNQCGSQSSNTPGRGRGFSDPTSSNRDRVEAEGTQEDPNDRSIAGSANETEQSAELPEVSGVGSSAASSVTIRGRGSLGNDSSLDSSASPPLASKRLNQHHKLARGPKARSRSSGPASTSARSASRGRSKRRDELNLEAIDLLTPVETKIRLMEGPVPLPSPFAAGDPTSPGVGLRRVFWPPPAPRASSGSSQRQEPEGDVKALDDATANRSKKRSSLLPSSQATQSEGSGRRRAATLMAQRIVADAEVKLEAAEQTRREQEEQTRLRRQTEYEFEEKEMEWNSGGLFRMR